MQSKRTPRGTFTHAHLPDELTSIAVALAVVIAAGLEVEDVERTPAGDVLAFITVPCPADARHRSASMLVAAEPSAVGGQVSAWCSGGCHARELVGWWQEAVERWLAGESGFMAPAWRESVPPASSPLLRRGPRGSRRP